MVLELQSPCKINLLLNVLGRRPDGFHELETVLHPVPICDLLQFEESGGGIHLECSHPALPVDSNNLAHRAASAFFKHTRIPGGVRIRLEKRLPTAAGLGGGSGNAATTLRALNQLFDAGLNESELVELAASLGSDIPFFLQNRPALATGRGEKIMPLDFFPALQGLWIVLVHPGFGISTPWAYHQLGKFPEALNGHPGRAQRLLQHLQTGDVGAAADEFYNSLEAPALRKYPLLALIQEFFRAHGAVAALMSGSGSATFALMKNEKAAKALLDGFLARFGEKFWTVALPLNETKAAA